MVANANFDGNTAQIRAISEQLASAFGRGVDEERHLLAQVDKRIEEKIGASESRLKLWVFGGVVTQLLAMVPIIFFLGGIYSTNTQTLALIQKQQDTLDRQLTWRQQREKWEQAVEAWGEPKGLKLPAGTIPSQ